MEKKLPFLIYGALLALALGLVTSTSILALSHILMVIPIGYFLLKADYRSYAKSSWALLAFALLIIASIVFNQDIAIKGYAPLSKSKYFLIGFLTIAPLQWFFKNHCKDKQIKILLHAFFIATTFATLVGIFSRYWEFNPITWRKISPIRNAGLSGMVMNYAHNLSFFLVIMTGLVIYRDRLRHLIHPLVLMTFFIINLVGFYLTYTRGAWLAFLVAVPFFLFEKQKKLFIGAFVLMFISGGFFYQLAKDSVVRPQSEKERISQWQAATMAFKERPILGYGYLNFEQHSKDLKIRYNIGEQNFGGHAHSNLFEVLGSTGILGSLAFFLWILFWFLEVQQAKNIIQKIALPFLVAFFVGGLTQSTISLGFNLFF